MLIKEDKRMFMVMMIIRKSIKEKKTFFYSIKFQNFIGSFSIRLTNLSNCKMRCDEEEEEKVFFSFVTVSFHHRYNMSKFHIFNVFFYFATYILQRAEKKEKKRVIYEWSLFMRFTFFSSDTPQSKEI